MPYVEDENGDHITDENGNKLEYTVSYKHTDFVYVNREPLYIKNNGHVDTENRNLVIKDAINSNHAVSKAQLDGAITNLKSEITTLIQSSIQTALNKFSSDFRKALIEFRNKQIRGRIGRKSLTIPKTNHTWIKLLDASEIDGATTLQDSNTKCLYKKK